MEVYGDTSIDAAKLKFRYQPKTNLKYLYFITSLPL